MAVLGDLPIPLWVIQSWWHHRDEGPFKVAPLGYPTKGYPELRGRPAKWLPHSGVFVLSAGSTVYTCMLNHRGGTESDLTVSRLAPSPQTSPLAPAFEGKRCLEDPAVPSTQPRSVRWPPTRDALGRAAEAALESRVCPLQSGPGRSEVSLQAECGLCSGDAGLPALSDYAFEPARPAGFRSGHSVRVLSSPARKRVSRG